MIVKHYHKGKAYTVEFPEGTRVHRDDRYGVTTLFVPDDEFGEAIVSDRPSAMIVEFAREGLYGMKLLEPVEAE